MSNPVLHRDRPSCEPSSAGLGSLARRLISSAAVRYRQRSRASGGQVGRCRAGRWQGRDLSSRRSTPSPPTMTCALELNVVADALEAKCLWRRYACCGSCVQHRWPSSASGFGRTLGPVERREAGLLGGWQRREHNGGGIVAVALPIWAGTGHNRVGQGLRFVGMVADESGQLLVRQCVQAV